MKKTLFKSLFLTAFVFSSIILAGCNIQIADVDTLTRPDLSNTSSGVGITFIPQSSDTLYINLYRQKITASGDEPVYDIGIIFPSAYSKTQSTYFYEDKCVIKGQKYRYRVRYYEQEDGYFYSGWTDEYQVVNGLDSATTDSDLLYNTSASSLVYDSVNKTLTVKGSPAIPAAITDFDKSYTPAIVFSYTDPDDSSQKIYQALGLDDAEYSANGTLIDGAVITLLSLLPVELTNTQITLEGIVGQIKETVEVNSEKTVSKVTWSNITKIPMTENGKTITTLNIVTDHGSSGFIY